MAVRKTRIAYPFPKAGHSQRCFATLMAFFTLLPHCLYSALLPYFLTTSLSGSIKEPSIQTPQDGFLEVLVCHLLRQPAFQIKSYCLLQHLISQLTGMLYGDQSELVLGNKSTCSKLAPLEATGDTDEGRDDLDMVSALQALLTRC